MADILDNEEIEQHEVGTVADSLVISVPFIFVCADENSVGKDRTTQNLRLIPYNTLDSIMRLGIEIPSATHEQLLSIWSKLTNILLESTSSMKMPNNVSAKESYEEILSFFNFASTISGEISLDDEYSDGTCQSISFDVIRRYENDPDTMLLRSAEPVIASCGAVLYSQIPDETTRQTVRRETNDTDINRFHYCLQCFERTLRFEPGWVYNKSVKVINLALLHLCLVCNSRPIKFLSSNDLKANILSYILDVIVRSRVIQAWQNQPSSKMLLADIVKNYEPNQIIVTLCRLPSSQTRAKYLLNEFAKVPKLSQICSSLSYETYEQLLHDARQTIEGETYYVFDNKFLLAVVALQSFESIKQLSSSLTSDSFTTKI